MRLLFWLTHPVFVYYRLLYWVWEKRNPDKPWLCPDTVRFCERQLTKTMRMLEFGSGRSTRWFAARVEHITSIEHQAGWYEKVKAQLAEAGATNINYQLAPLDDPEAELKDPGFVPAYVRRSEQFADASLDFIIIDGHYRDACIQHTIAQGQASGGYFLVDDINFWSSPDVLPIPKTWKIVDDSTNGLKRCLIWQAASR